MATHSAESHNSTVRSSGKVGRNSAPLSVARLAACSLAKRLCLPLTFRNLYVIEMAIEAERTYAENYNWDMERSLAFEQKRKPNPTGPVSVSRAAATIMEGAILALEMGECVNYFWFEDCCWRRPKLSFKDRDYLHERARRGGL
jgi:hypothetical protein